VWNTVVFQCIWSRVDIITTKGQIFICRAGGGQNSAAVYRDIAFAFALYVRPSRRREICPESFAVKMVEWIALAEQRVGIATCDISSARLGEAVFIPGFRGISPPACAPNSLVTASSGPDSITQGFR